MKRLFVTGLLFVFMAVAPVVSAFADNNQTCDGRIENYVSATGTVAQNGTPSPDNPIEPVFYKQGDMVLRKVGDYADSYDATTGKITRRVGVKVFNGEESGLGSDGIFINNQSGYIGLHKSLFPGIKMESPTVYSTHWQQGAYISPSGAFCSVSGSVYFAWNKASTPDLTTQQSIKNWLIQQYADGTPVVVYYPLATETTENWNETTYCAPNIKIATTAYNAARFNPVKTDLNNAVATIREIVTKTINQTAAIASLQADKQTRPEDACPAGKKCLLVETEENGVIVPHWFPIIEAPEE